MHPMTINIINDYYTTTSKNTQKITTTFITTILFLATTPLYYFIINRLTPEHSTIITLTILCINIIMIIVSYMALQYDIKYCQTPHFSKYSSTYYYYQDMFDNEKDKNDFYQQLSLMCLQYNEEEDNDILLDISCLLSTIDNNYFNHQVIKLEKELKHNNDLVDF